MRRSHVRTITWLCIAISLILLVNRFDHSNVPRTVAEDSVAKRPHFDKEHGFLLLFGDEGFSEIERPLDMQKDQWKLSDADGIDTDKIPVESDDSPKERKDIYEDIDNIGNQPEQVTTLKNVADRIWSKIPVKPGESPVEITDIQKNLRDRGLPPEQLQNEDVGKGDRGNVPMTPDKRPNEMLDIHEVIKQNQNEVKIPEQLLSEENSGKNVGNKEEPSVRIDPEVQTQEEKPKISNLSKPIIVGSILIDDPILARYSWHWEHVIDEKINKLWWKQEGIVPDEENCKDGFFKRFDPLYWQKRNEIDRVQYTIDNPDFCQDHLLDVLIVVNSDPSSSERRNLIRQTWGSVKKYRDVSIGVLFLLGISKTIDYNIIRNEYVYQRDLLMPDLVESFHNETHKSLFALRYVSEYCATLKFVITTHDDVFVNVYGLLNHLITNDFFRYGNRVLCGDVRSTPNTLNVIRNNSLIKQIGLVMTCNDYPYEYYPPHCSGVGYGMNLKLAREMYGISLITKNFPLSDVYVTGILRNMGPGDIDFVAPSNCWLAKDVLSALDKNLLSLCIFYETKIGPTSIEEQIKKAWKSIEM